MSDKEGVCFFQIVKTLDLFTPFVFYLLNGREAWQLVYFKKAGSKHRTCFFTDSSSFKRMDTVNFDLALATYFELSYLNTQLLVETQSCLIPD